MQLAYTSFFVYHIITDKMLVLHLEVSLVLHAFLNQSQTFKKMGKYARDLPDDCQIFQTHSVAFSKQVLPTQPSSYNTCWCSLYLSTNVPVFVCFYVETSRHGGEKN